MKKSIKKYILLFMILLLIPFNVKAILSDYTDVISEITNSKMESSKINIYFFRGEGCPHCAKEEKWINSIKKKYDKKINVYDFEVWHSKKNAKYLEEVKSIFKVTNDGVPFTVIGNNYYLGYSSSIASKMESHIKKYLNIKTNTNEVTIPILGKINMKKVSIPLVAIILGFIDGFNPCAMWILLFLISMLLKDGNKVKRWILGLIFLLASAFVYFLSMLGINLILSIAAIKYLKIIIALFILTTGIIGLRNYILNIKKVAGCKVVKDDKRKKLFIKIKNIINSKSLLLSIMGIIILGASINLIELTCSLGFPVIFIELLNINNVSNLMKIIYLLIYIIFYMIDDIVVFVISMITLSATGITNKYNKLCTLISSIIMILIGLLLIFKPAWLMLNF